jgi:DNA ligase (NAD+)
MNKVTQKNEFNHLKKGTVKKELRKRYYKTRKNKVKSEIVNSFNIKTKDINNSMNKDFIDIMEQFASLMMKKGEPFRSRAYKKAAETLMTIKEPITDVKQLHGKPGIGKTIIEKLTEYQNTSKVEALEIEKNNPVNLFSEIYGIGPKKAQELVKKKVTTISMLKDRQDELLNDKQKIGLKYYDDIKERIPRSEIDEYVSIFDRVFKVLNNGDSKFEVVGSYRRGALDSGDIDVIITNTNNDSSIFKLFLDQLHKEGILVEFLSRGKTKSLTIGKLKSKLNRRLDFLYSSPDEYAFAVLYFTGSKEFNTLMRQQALNMGYTLNEHGISKMNKGIKGDIIDQHFPTEKSIFDFLGMKYKEPNERVGVNSLELDKSTIKSNKTLKNPCKNGKVKNENNRCVNPNSKTLKKKNHVKTTKDHIEEFKQKGVDYLNLLTKKELFMIIDDASKAYYNKHSIMSDNQFDIVKEYAEKKYPSDVFFDNIGAPVEKNKVKLPYNMPSMDKIKPDTKALTKWMNKYKGPFVLSAKLDGISAMYTTENGKVNLFTRGNGSVGQDISHLIPYLDMPKANNICVRGELIMKKSIFEKKYEKTFSNARNMVAGLVNHKNVDKDKIHDVEFIAYEVIQPSLKPSEQMSFLNTKKIKTVINEVTDSLTNDYLSEKLVHWREHYEYVIDGVIVADDKIYKRLNKNPEHSFAFKMVLSDQIAEAKVLNVLWSPSKDGYLKPRIQIEQVVLGGAKIEYATAFNAAFVVDNKIGIGSIVKLIRSGDVIPHIMEVIESAEEAKMPNESYIWNDTHIDIMLEKPNANQVVIEKNITSFFKGLEVTGLGSGNIKKIMAAGFTSVPEIIAMNKDDFLKVEGFKEKMALKVYTSIHDKIKEASIVKIMAVSNIFGRGFGEKKMDLIISNFPDILISNESDNEKIDKIKNVKGIEQKTAEKFVFGIVKFLEFIKEAKIEYKLNNAINNDTNVMKHVLNGKNIVITGFRNKEFSKQLKLHGVKESNAVSKKTDFIVVKDKNDTTSKLLKAKELLKPNQILTLDEFTETYF